MFKLSHRLLEAAPADAAPAGGPKSIEKVKLTDGREVEFVGKRKMLKESIFAENETPVIRLDFKNGETRSFKLPPELLYRFAAHGAEQKLGDETAGETDVDDMVLAVDELIDRLSKRAEDGSFAGEWNTKREGGGMSGTSVLLKALMELSNKPVEVVKEFLKGKSQAEKIAMRNSAKVKPIIDRLEAEKLAKAEKVDTDALLGQLA